MQQLSDWGPDAPQSLFTSGIKLVLVMSKGHFESAGGYIDYGDATALFPVEDLDAVVHQYRDAQLALADVDGSDVIAVAPTSMAAAYALGGHPLTAISMTSLPVTLRTQLAGELDGSIDRFELIQVGRWTVDSPNHSLAEFTNA
jgi:hypothetical protein